LALFYTKRIDRNWLGKELGDAEEEASPEQIVTLLRQIEVATSQGNRRHQLCEWSRTLRDIRRRLGGNFETSFYSPPGAPVDAVVPFVVGDSLFRALRSNCHSEPPQLFCGRAS